MFNNKRYQCLGGYIIPKYLTSKVPYRDNKVFISIFQSCLHFIIFYIKYYSNIWMRTSDGMDVSHKITAQLINVVLLPIKIIESFC